MKSKICQLTRKMFISSTVCVLTLLSQSSVLAQDGSEEPMEELTVVGYRGSLQQAMSLKRDAVNSRESIVSEDIGKMPDLNLAEAIQRSPGVVIVREGGEGRQISLRGLGAGFTSVTLNGMEVPASVGGLDSSGGINRGRSFDFNVFSAELFSRIDVNKSPTASIEEGGLAGNVELYTIRPLDNAGLNLVASAQMANNQQSGQTDPRLAFIFSNTNDDETFGYMFALTQTDRTAHQDGFGTVRWTTPNANAGGTGAFAVNNTGISDAAMGDIWFPRLPRADSFHHEQERTGMAGALQFRPNDTMEIGLNYVHSEFDATINSYNSFAQFRGGGGFSTITANSVTLDGSGREAIAGSFSDVNLRTESRQADDNTAFDQFTVDFKIDLSDSLSLSAMVGNAKSEFEGDVFRVNIDTVDTDFTYDFTGSRDVAMIAYPSLDTSSAANFTIQGNHQVRRYNVDRTNDTLKVDLDWTLNDEHSIGYGLISNTREVDSKQANGSPVIPADLSAISKVYNYDGGGTNNGFVVLDFGLAIPAYTVEPYTLAAGRGVETWNVEEETLGLYVDYNLNTELAGRAFRLNAGVRYVDTDVTALGYLDVNTTIIETNSYDHVLPSINVAFDASEDLVLRAGISTTITRPSLSSVAPSKDYTDVTRRIRGGNSQLIPQESDNIDLGVEWYFAEDSVVAFNFFTKDIDSLITSPSEQGPLRPEDVPVVTSLYPGQPNLINEIWTYETSANGDGTEVDGWELAYQQPFTFLPGIWSNFGILLNYSSVDATTKVTRNNVVEDAPLQGLSETSWNGTVYYEVETWGARLSVNNRDDYITRNLGRDGNREEGTTGPTRLDLSAFYHINDHITLTFEGINLTDEKERLYTTGDGTQNLIREYNKTGTEYFIGVRYSMQ